VGDFQPISNKSAAVVFVGCGHVGNALALSIMSIAMLRARAVDWSTRLCLAHHLSG
jgi:hypothetical protein